VARAREGHRESTGQGGQGWSSPERRRAVEAVEDDSDGGVRWRGGSSGGRWRWRHDPVVSARKREDEGGLKWEQRWRMGGSHHEAVEPVVLERELERRGVSGGGSRRGGRVGGGEGGELELGRGMEWSEASAPSPNRRVRGGE
jgi:hypothetical protein